MRNAALNAAEVLIREARELLRDAGRLVPVEERSAMAALHEIAEHGINDLLSLIVRAKGQAD